ncbi:MAG TPA: hypothetical protein VHQ22_02950 [Terriglobales bacterium]|nr:hypothetical protein [Terriglobales bacterium]
MTASRGGFFSSPVPSVSRQLQVISITLLFAASTCIAQQGTPAAEPPNSSGAQASTNAESQPTTVTIPAGTHLALALTHPVDSRTTHHGDEIFAQTTSPLIVSNQVAIPAGTFVQGKVDKMNRRGSRGELLMQSLSVVFPNGYIATVKGPLTMETDEGTAWTNPSAAEKTGMIAAPIAGLGIGAAIGAAQHTTMSSSLGGTTLTASTPKGLAIGSLVGLAAGGAVSLILLARSRHFYVEEGSPLELSLPQPVTLAQIQPSNPDGATASTPAPPSRLPSSPTPASAMHGTCYIPGQPGTPSTYVPGTPGTANSPGTPDTYIPGTPPTPAIPYPCS